MIADPLLRGFSAVGVEVDGNGVAVGAGVCVSVGEADTVGVCDAGVWVAAWAIGTGVGVTGFGLMMLNAKRSTIVTMPTAARTIPVASLIALLPR